MSEDDERSANFCWDALAERAAHPVRVEIIEALRWIDAPVPATDLLRIFEGTLGGAWVQYHLRCLVQLRTVVKENGGEQVGRPVYRLAEQTT